MSSSLVQAGGSISNPRYQVADSFLPFPLFKNSPFGEDRQFALPENQAELGKQRDTARARLDEMIAKLAIGTDLDVQTM